MNLSRPNDPGLLEALQLSYEQHPQFRFEQASLVVDAVQLALFNDAYSLLHDYGTGLTSAESVACTRQCVASLQAVFTHLQAQTSDTSERHFLNELQAECSRLLLEELGQYGATAVPAGFRFGAAQVRSNAVALRRQRYYFGRLSAATVKQMLDLAAPHLARFRDAAREGRVRREDLTVSTGQHIRAMLKLLNQEFREQGVLDTVSAYMQRKMSVTGLALELSVPQATWWANSHAELSRPPKTLYAHLDESKLFPKSIAYLSDVDAQTGPTSCYPGVIDALQLHPLQELVGRVLANIGNTPGSDLSRLYAKQYHQSMSSQEFRRHFMKLPRELRFNSHFGWDILPGSGIEATLQACERFLTGGAGSYIVFDGARLLHRGGMLRGGERIALQIIFSDLTLTQRVIRKIKALT